MGREAFLSLCSQAKAKGWGCCYGHRQEEEGGVVVDRGWHRDVMARERPERERRCIWAGRPWNDGALGVREMADGVGHLREGLSTGFAGKWREEGVIENTGRRRACSWQE